MKKISVKTKQRNEWIDITHEVKNYVTQKNISSGLCTVYVPHTTAGVTVNENADPSVQRDIISHLSKLIPYSESFSQ